MSVGRALCASCVCSVVLAACASAPATTQHAGHASASDTSPAPVSIPTEPAVRELPRVRVASGIANPRGLWRLQDGSLLVAAAGTGDPASPNTGELLHLTDANGDGDYDDEGERATLVGEQPSKNILDIVRRDEVFGMAGMAEGEGAVLVSLAFFGGPSRIMRIGHSDVKSLAVDEWTTTHANINDLTYDPGRKAWFGVASTTDEVVQLNQGARSERVVKIPPLASGQDPVPGYLVHDPLTGDLLVSLFSGSPEGEEGGEGVELIPRAASIVRVKPETRAIEPVITELTVPTDLEATPEGVIYVIEFCDAFLDPVKTRQDMEKGASHGGFRRFSGRLLRIDRMRGDVTVLARGLDAPTNMLLAGNSLYIAEGMGTPGRLIPGPSAGGAPVALNGFIERIDLPAP